MGRDRMRSILLPWRPPALAAALLHEAKTIYNVIADLRHHWGRGPVQSHLGRFGFSGDTVQRTTDNLGPVLDAAVVDIFRSFPLQPK